MLTIEPKKWKAGIADEVWKVIIAGRDLNTTEDLLHSLSYYLTDAGSNYKLGLERIRKMSGEQIVQALIDHQEKSLQSVKNGLNK